MFNISNKNRSSSVKIEGILSEVDISPRTYVNQNGQPTESLSGQFKVRVQQTIAGRDTTLEIPVHVFANKYTTKGEPNSAYASIEKLKNEYVSIAAGGIENADWIRITGATVAMNEYYNNKGELVSFPRISASFVNKISAADATPEATFWVKFVIGSMEYEKDSDGVENPNRFKIRGIVPQYGETVDVVDFYAITPNTIDGVQSVWTPGETVTAAGKLNFTAVTEERQVQVAFGDPRIEKRTVSVSEFIITSGSEPVDGEFAFDSNDIQAALSKRQARLAELKDKPAKQANRPAQPSKPAGFDLGF